MSTLTPKIQPPVIVLGPSVALSKTPIQHFLTRTTTGVADVPNVRVTNPPPAGLMLYKAADSFLRDETTMYALPTTCMHEGFIGFNSVEDDLLKAVGWLSNLKRLEASVSELAKRERVREVDEKVDHS